MKNFFLLLLLSASVSWVMAKETCPASLDAHVPKWDAASDDCIASANKNLTSMMEKEYKRLLAHVSKNSDDGDGLSKENLLALKKAYPEYATAICNVKAESYDLQKNQQYRAGAICTIMDAQKHLKFLQKL